MADMPGYDFSLVRYQILAYADRNNFCHSGSKAMTHRGDFQNLAARLMQDKRSLKIIFRGKLAWEIRPRVHSTNIRVILNYLHVSCVFREEIDLTSYMRLFRALVKVLARTKESAAIRLSNYTTRNL